MVTRNSIKIYSTETSWGYSTELKMDSKESCECDTEPQSVSKSKKKSTQSLKKSQSKERPKQHAKDADNQVRKKPLESSKKDASAAKCQPKPNEAGAANNMETAEDQTTMAGRRLAEVETRLRELQESYRRKQWRHFRYLLPDSAACLNQESDLAAAAIVSLRDQVHTLQQTIQEIQERGEDQDMTSLKKEIRRLREDKERLSDRLEKAIDVANTYRQQLEEADLGLERAAKRQGELQRDYSLAHKALESVICDAREQEYAVNAAQAGRHSADVILQLQLRVAELEGQLQAEKATRAQLEAEAAERQRPPPTPSAASVKQESKRAGSLATKKGKGGGGDDGPTAEELTEHLQAVTAELREARALLDEAETVRKQQAADYAVLREDVRELHSRVAAVTQLAKRERSFSDALKEALEDMEVQWRRQFQEDEQQLRLAERRQKEADLKLASAEDALSCCRTEAGRLAASLQACRDREGALRNQLLAKLPQPPSKLIEYLGVKLDQTEHELEEVRNQLRDEQQVTAILEAELCDYDEFFIDGTVKSYRMALTLTETSNENQELMFIRTIDLENEILLLKEQVEQLRVEKLCVIQQCAEELSTSRYLFEEAFNQLIPKAYHSDYQKSVKLTLCPRDECNHQSTKQETIEKTAKQCLEGTKTPDL